MSIKTYQKGKSEKLSANFTSKEFDCQGSGCCTETLIDEKLVQYLQKFREYFGKPVNINSGYRCKIHNANIGGASKSNHMDGEAADIRISGVTPLQLAQYAEYIGILGIGVYSWGIHIDTRTTKYFWYDGGATNVKTFGTPDIQEKKKVVKAGIVSDNSDEKAKKIWEFLMKEIGNPYGVAGLMGNLYAESGLRSNNLQDTYQSKLGYTDQTYTKAVDENTYTNFIKDSAGYGLAQWTYHTRKQGLLKYADEAEISIGDYETQLKYLMYELKNNFKTVFETLKKAKTVAEASNIVLTQFENPLDKSDKMKATRAQYSENYYQKFGVEKGNTIYAIAQTAMHIREKETAASKSLGVIAKGTKVEVVEILASGWYKIKWNGTIAYTSNTTGTYYILEGAYKVRIVASTLNIRSGPSTNYQIIGHLSKNSLQTILEEQNGWGKLKNDSGWIKLSYTKREG